MPNPIGTYTAYSQITNVNNARTLMTITVPAPYLVEIVEAHVTVPDTTDRQLEAAVKNITNITGVVATATAASVKHTPGQAADPSQVLAGITSEPGGYGTDGFGHQALPGRSGWHFDTSIPKQTTVVANSNANTGLGIYLVSGMTNGMTVDVAMTYRIYG